MEIRRLTANDRAQAEYVWKVCFEDSDAFIKTYFEYAADIKQGLGIFEQEKLLSDLFVLPFEVNLSGARYTAPFLAGCATLPEARKQNHMRMLVKRALLDMKQNGIAVSFLHPFLHAFYRKFGYETVAYVKPVKEMVQPKENSTVIYARTMEEVPVQLMEQAYRSFTGSYDNYFVRSRARFDAWLRLLFADGGEVVYLPGEKEVAYALYYVNGEEADVFELVYFSEAQRSSLLGAVKAQAASYVLPSAPEGAEEHTMMRVLDPMAVLRNYVYAQDTLFTIGIEDAFLETDYKLSVNSTKNGVAVKQTDGICDFTVDMQTLAQLVTGAYDKAIDSKAATLFAPKTSCFFEQY